MPYADKEKAKEYHRAYSRAWAKRNRDKIGASARTYRQRNPEKVRQWHNEWIEKNQERAREIARMAYFRNPEKTKARTKDYRLRNTEEVDRKSKIRKQQWRLDKPEKERAQRHRRRANLAQVTSNFTASDWKRLVSTSKFCHWCKEPFNKKRRATHDHVIPISKGGGNTLENSVCACGSCNSKKRDKLYNPSNGQGILL